MTLAIDIPDAQLEQLRERASRLGVTLEDLARAMLSAQLGQSDADFEAAAEAVLRKNDELYRRLA